MSTPASLRHLKNKGTKTSRDPEWSDQELKIDNRAVRPYNGTSDWLTEDGEAVITIIPIRQHLFDQWELQARHANYVNALGTVNGEPADEEQTIEVYNHSDFENDFRGPGIYRDDQNLDQPDKMDETYTIILPINFQTPEIVDNYINALNEKFDRNFVHEEIDTTSRVKDMHKSQIKKEFEGESKASLDEVLDKTLTTIGKR